MEFTRRGGGAGSLALLALALGIMVWGGFFLWTQDTRRGSRGPEYSVERTDERGAALVYRLYQKAGLVPKVWDGELTRLSSPGLMIFIAPAREITVLNGAMSVGSIGDFLPVEMQKLDAWVARGNVAVVMSREDNPLYRGLGLIVDEPKGNSRLAAQPLQPGVLTNRVGELRTETQFGFKFGHKKDAVAAGLKVAEAPQPIPMIHPDRWVTLFEKNDGGRKLPQVVSAARGKGLYVAVNDAYPAGNLGISQGDNARFMLNLARLTPNDGTLWFDEYHKREIPRNPVAYLRERAMFPVLIYALLLFALVLWKSGIRFGDPHPLVADRRRDSGEYLAAVAALYRNAGMNREALATNFADFRRRLYGALRADGLTDLEEIGRRYETHTGRPSLEARQALIETEAALARPKLTEQDALQFCSRLTRIDEALRQPGRTSGPT